MNKVNRILGVVLGIQVLLFVVVHLGSQSTSIGKLSPVVKDFDTGKVTRVQVFDSTATVASKSDDSKKKGDTPAIVLVKHGDKWTLANYHDYPVEGSKVSDLLDKISGMQARGAVAHGTARARQLDVADDSYQRKVVLTAGGHDLTLYIGSSAGGRMVSVRLAGKDTIYGVSGVSAYGVGVDPTSWVDPEYFKVEDKDIASFDVVNQSGTFSFTHGEGDDWTVAVNGAPLAPAKGKEIDTDAIKKVVREIGTIRMAEPGDPARKIETPLATVTVRMKPPKQSSASAAGGASASDAGAAGATPTPPAAGPQHVLIIAKAAPKDGESSPRYYVHTQKSPTAAVVRGASLEGLIKVSVDTLTKDQSSSTGGTSASTGAPPAPGAPPSFGGGIH